MEHIFSDAVQNRFRLNMPQNISQDAQHTIYTQELLLEIKATLEILKLKIAQLERLGNGNVAQLRRPDKIVPHTATGAVEGVFDGTHMIDAEGNKYEVPQNYASKSKLVEGDILQMLRFEDGRILFKQLEHVETKTVIGDLKTNNGEYTCNVQDKCYKILPAAVMYFRVQPGDRLTLIIPKYGDSIWAAVQGIF
jgi:hypothetical protein